MNPQSNQPLTSHQYFKTLNLIHTALFVGPLIFAAVSAYFHLSDENNAIPAEPDGVFQIAVPVVVLGGMLASNFIFRRRLGQIRQLQSLYEKTRSYISISIVRFALLEGPALFALVVFFITGKNYYLLMAGLLLMLLLVNKPTRFKLINDLQLTQEERKTIENPDALLQ